ncbi:MAG: sulfurtransferase [Ectothiorhodospiraceae bacterium AqS1]|nr:sulfurtransferase [Ectothiorhodospiraceae bacterium AqS1]
MSDVLADWPLLTPDALASLLDGGAKDVVVLDIRRGEHYSKGHIPGARHFSVFGINTYDSDPAQVASFTKMWAFQIALTGIRRQDRVVVCGARSDDSAARAFWFLEYLGHPQVALLDGGIRAWERSGRSLTQDATPPSPVAYPLEESVPSLCANWRDVKAAIDDPQRVILDTRSDEEWYGEDSRGTKRGGAIPAALHREWSENLDDHGCFLEAEEIRSEYAAMGITEETPVIAYCNTGYRSAHTYLALRLIGHRNVRNYISSWQEWGNRIDDCPVVVHERE